MVLELLAGKESVDGAVVDEKTSRACIAVSSGGVQKVVEATIPVNEGTTEISFVAGVRQLAVKNPQGTYLIPYSVPAGRE